VVEDIGQPNLKVELTSSPAAKPGVGNVRRVSLVSLWQASRDAV